MGPFPRQLRRDHSSSRLLLPLNCLMLLSGQLIYVRINIMGESRSLLVPEFNAREDASEQQFFSGQYDGHSYFSINFVYIIIVR